MNMQERMIDKRTFRIAVIAVAAAVLLAAAAYLFGAGLRADTSASVAPSPLGSSLTAVREARAVEPSALGVNSADSRGARTIISAARAASLAALATSRSSFYADQNATARATWRDSLAIEAERQLQFYADLKAFGVPNMLARSAAQAALAKSRSDFYADLNDTNAAASDQSVWTLTTRSAARAALAKSRSDFYADLNDTNEAASDQSVWTLTARSAARAALAKSRSDFYGDMNAAAEASRWAAVAAHDKDLVIFYGAVNATNAAAK